MRSFGAVFAEVRVDPDLGAIRVARMVGAYGDVILLDEDDPHVNPIGVKGIGEIGTTGVAAAPTRCTTRLTSACATGRLRCALFALQPLWLRGDDRSSLYLAADRL